MDDMACMLVWFSFSVVISMLLLLRLGGFLRFLFLVLCFDFRLIKSIFRCGNAFP